jgi:arsenate reductase (thioredoxin)
MEPPIKKAQSLPIAEERKKLLSQLADYIRNKAVNDGIADLNFICTHNSRRSHFGQVMAAVAAWHYNVPVRTWSGGVEVTAFNPRAIASLRRLGMAIPEIAGENPKYEVTFAKDALPILCFSKTYDDTHNPQSGFAAVMVCSSAEQNCPFVAGADKRISITYEDPGNADGTPDEAQVYDERALQILSEMLYVFSLIKLS